MKNKKNTVIRGFLIVSLIFAIFQGYTESKISGEVISYTHYDATAGQWQIWRMLPDGTIEHQISTSGAGENDFEPALSSDGTKLAFERDDGTTRSIWVMCSSGEDPHQVSTPGVGEWDSDAAWSPDGTEIAFRHLAGGTQWQIWVMNADGTNEHQVSTPAVGEDDYDPGYSPDGTEIVYTKHDGTHTEIWMMNADGTNEHQVSTPGVNDWDWHSDWSPDGTEIVFHRAEYGVPRKAIWMMNADGTNEHQVSTPVAGDEDLEPTWSPDGTEIAYQHWNATAGQWQIWVMNANGTNEHQVSTPGAGWPYNDNDPDWGFLVPCGARKRNRIYTGLPSLEPLALTRISEATDLLEKAQGLCQELSEKEDEESKAKFEDCCSKAKFDEVEENLKMAKDFFSRGHYIAANNFALKAKAKIEEIIECCEG